jgi:hypothetical protein
MKLGVHYLCPMSAAIAKLRGYAEREDRVPRASAGDETSWREEFKFWKSAGVTHVTVNSAFEPNHHPRIASRSLQARLTALERYSDAIADLL